MIHFAIEQLHYQGYLILSCQFYQFIQSFSAVLQPHFICDGTPVAAKADDLFDTGVRRHWNQFFIIGIQLIVVLHIIEAFGNAQLTAVGNRTF